MCRRKRAASPGETYELGETGEAGLEDVKEVEVKGTLWEYDKGLPELREPRVKGKIQEGKMLIKREDEDEK